MSREGKSQTGLTSTSGSTDHGFLACLPPSGLNLKTVPKESFIHNEIKVLWILCVNLTDAQKKEKEKMKRLLTHDPPRELRLVKR